MDGKQVMVHRIILSSNSIFFKNLLVSSKHNHPIIHLTGIKHRYLEMVLKLIYLGQCHIGQEDLKEFLSTGKELGLDELIEEINIEKVPKLTTMSSKDPYLIDILEKRNSLEKNKVQLFEISINTQIHKPIPENFSPAGKLESVSKMEDCLSQKFKEQHLSDIQNPNNLETTLVLQKAQYLTDSSKFEEHFEKFEECVTQELQEHICEETSCKAKTYEACTNSSRKKFALNKMIYSADTNKDTSNEPKKKKRKQKGNYECETCNIYFTRKFNLDKHNQSKHEVAKLMCGQCSYKTSIHELLKRHKQSRHDGVKLFCDQCDFHTYLPDYLKGHIKRHKLNKQAKQVCDQCNKSVTYLKKHIQSVHNYITYDCDQFTNKGLK